jgi:hypothetical protein
MPEQSGGFLARSGLDSIRIAGHKVPIALLAGLVALIGVVAILRARQRGQQVGSVGAAPATAADSAFGLPVPSSDVGPALANLSQQLNDLSQSVTGSNASPAPSLVTLEGRAGYMQNALGQAILAIWKAPGTSGGQLTQLPAGTQLESAGVPVAGEAYGGSGFWQPVKLPGGGTGYVWAPDTLVTNPPITH